MRDPDSARALRPLRRLALPGGRTLLRAGLVAALLGLAAAVLHTPTGCPPATRASPSPDPLGAAGPTDSADGQPTGTEPIDGPSTGTRATTDARSGPLPLPTGAVGVPVRLAEPAALAVVRPGFRVDLLAAPPGGAGAEATLLASRALVLDVLGDGAADGSSALYLALNPDQAQRAVGLPEGSRFAIVVRG
ncbi:flagellar biosynthesis protein FlgA [Micromonospora acroterricola]|uniref:Flagellar biosynthesis protein FlgA n=1 Tax=Micromonospora acroterricola TaxID=2202421 RepID=A0A317CQP4_9ACTN|nr:flagellar biosynthesis protein FlgA [Micromonospora acroterricola]PWR04881.1 flagellar biosynthesis protein FlgA [Micromonospora acroterricola]